MITITDNSVQQINAALLSIKSDLDQIKSDTNNSIKNVKSEVDDSIKSINTTDNSNSSATPDTSEIEEIINEALSGGTYDIDITGNANTATIAASCDHVSGDSGGSLVKARDFAVAKNTGSTGTLGSIYRPTISVKTYSGEWSIGSLSGDNNLYFSYTTDSNYNNNYNTADTFTLDTNGNLLGTYFNNNHLYPIRRLRQTFSHSAGTHSASYNLSLTNGSLIIADWSAVTSTFGGVVIKLDGSNSTISNVNISGRQPTLNCTFSGDVADANFTIYVTVDYVML